VTPFTTRELTPLLKKHDFIQVYNILKELKHDFEDSLKNNDFAGPLQPFQAGQSEGFGENSKVIK